MDRQKSALTIFVCILGLSCRGTEGPVGPPGHDASESLTDPSIQPKVIFTVPAANTQGPYSNFFSQLTVRFNKIMNPTSVRRALQISAPAGNIIVDTNSVRTTGGDFYTFNAIDTTGRSSTNRWKVGLVYTLSISDSAIDINGNYLHPAYSMTFAPEPFFRVRTVTPADGASEVGLGQSIILQFNAPIDSAFSSFIHISPPTAGFWHFDYYSDSSRLTIISLLSLEVDSTYEIFVDTIAHDRKGNHLPVPFRSTFRTVPFLVVYSYPSAGWMVDRSTVIEIDTDAPYDSLTVPGSFSITPATSGTWRYIPGGTFFTFTATDSLLPRTEYTVVLSTALRSLSGKQLKTPYAFTFTTGD